ncbi:hypothetical protein [Mesorhizobium sp. M6A.T.Cr.TU.017.01.1.1]|uniref:hypothetical protein n=1 Tax=Mesorhizobium sp. M6A.T.Cr.TU.017.01.1.1 TaxID=2496774 RepID=UPI0019D46D34|nr:hypothetical protein [Mesorhizobium sp. M6A.T.Cr.TU.017.01.1.1]
MHVDEYPRYEEEQRRAEHLFVVRNQNGQRDRDQPETENPQNSTNDDKSQHPKTVLGVIELNPRSIDLNTGV